jgi:SAM-dependent methyltransferase
MSCDLVFYDQRFARAEIEKLYTGYRGLEYVSVRNKWEPWYTPAFNDRLGGEEEINIRRLIYQDTLASVAMNKVNTVLDFAGDSGQLMPRGPGEQHFVYEISGAKPVEGVTLIANEATLAGRAFDLVLLCHVAEHFSAPHDEVGAVVKYVEPGGLLYVEVPSDRMRLSDIPKSRLYDRYLDFLANHPRILLIMDAFSSFIRVKLKKTTPLSFVKLHEHINFFNAKSLCTMLDSLGLEIISCVTREEFPVVVALCRRPEL